MFSVCYIIHTIYDLRLVDDQADSEIDQDRGTKAKHGCKNKENPNERGIHTAPICKARTYAHQLAIGFVELKFVFHRAVFPFV